MLSKTKPIPTVSKNYILVRLTNKSASSPMFIDTLDRAYFVSLLQRYLTTNRPKFTEYSPYKNYSYDIELVAFSLTETAIDLLMYQLSVAGNEQFVRSVTTSYNRYFNRRHNMDVQLFRKPNTTFLSDKDAVTASRNIHRQANDWRTTRYSSLGFYVNERRGDWVKPGRITDNFHHDGHKYLRYVTADESLSHA